jgi:hypothetical protein
MGDSGGLYHPRAFQFDLTVAEVAEQPDTPSKQHGHEVNLDFVQQVQLQALLRELAAPTATVLSPATAFACSTALSTPSLTKVKGDPS